ncbi:hypothetical protein JNJ66_06420 [Candidatus Saccharibacteria bacterium]|nr:hypothetical protein [Candidatus Saccharibacteria bacterium]
MPGKFLITGYPGTGKSSVARALQHRGHTAYDTEAMPGYMHAESHGGQRIHLPSPVPAGWFDRVGAYNWNVSRIERLLQQPGEAYFCALADNQPLFYDRFDKIFLLLLDETVMLQRLHSRTERAYGHDRQELSDIMLMHRHFEQSLVARGAVGITTQKALPEVVADILAHSYTD